MSRRQSNSSSSSISSGGGGGSFGSRRGSVSDGGGPDAKRPSKAAPSLGSGPPCLPAAAASAAARPSLLPPRPSTTAATACWLALNISASVALVLVNKQALNLFPRPVALSALHFFACGAALFFAGRWQGAGQGRGPGEKQPPQQQRARLAAPAALRLSVLGALSVAALNLSLRTNSVGVFQASKLLIAPLVAAVEAAAVGTSGSSCSPSRPSLLLLSLASLSAGALLVGAADRDRLSPRGLAAAACAALLSALQQVAAAQSAQQQQRHQKPGLSPAALLAQSAPLQGALLLALSPLLDPSSSSLASAANNPSGGSSPRPPGPAWLWLGASAALALVVNLSQFGCLASLRASTFAAASNAKALAVFTAAAVLPPVPGAGGEPARGASALGSAGAALCVVGAAGWTSGVARWTRRRSGSGELGFGLDGGECDGDDATVRVCASARSSGPAVAADAHGDDKGETTTTTKKLV